MSRNISAKLTPSPTECRPAGSLHGLSGWRSFEVTEAVVSVSSARSEPRPI